MKILEMTATFGCLEHAVLRPGPGLTLVHAPNEKGKSTWAAFLRAMFYGFPARERDKAGHLAEKNRYQPWSGSAMEGSLRLEWKGRELTLYRGQKGSVPWGSFSAVWSATGEPVEGLTGENCGEALLGVSRDVFERTAFVGQDGAFLSPSAELEKRISALATSGEEEVSFSQVERRLKDWLNRRKVNSRVGLIPELEAQLSQTDAALERQGALLRQAQQARQEKEALEARQRELEERLQACAAAEKARQARRRGELQAEYDALSAQAEALRVAAQALPPAETLRQAQGDLAYLNTLSANEKLAEGAVSAARERAEAARRKRESDPRFAAQDAAQAAEQARRDCGEARRLMGALPSPLLLLSVPLFLSIVLSLWAYLRPRSPAASFPWWSVLAFLLPAVWLAGALLLLPLALLRRSRKRRCDALLARYAAQTPEDILAGASEYAAACAAAQTAEGELQSAGRELGRLAEQRRELSQRLLELVKPFAGEGAALSDIPAALSRALRQEEDYRLCQTRLQAVERLLEALPPAGDGPLPTAAAPTGDDPTQLAARLAAVRGELSRASDSAARLLGELNGSGDPAELEARRNALADELDRRREEYEALRAALDGLGAANDALRERFSPAVNQKAGEFLSALTGGRYGKASLTRQFQALVQPEEGAPPRQDLSLSAGTVQQLYLAFRLAMCELALPQDEPCPVVLDDALLAFDDHRAELALECLLALSEKRQILLFSCHSREEELLRGSRAALLSL